MPKLKKKSVDVRRKEIRNKKRELRQLKNTESEENIKKRKHIQRKLRLEDPVIKKRYTDAMRLYKLKKKRKIQIIYLSMEQKYLNQNINIYKIKPQKNNDV